MHKLKFLVIICLIVFTASCAQQKKYISYKVKHGETIKSIAKRLDVKTKDLLRLNPDVSKKPNPNTVIIIPNPDYDKTATTITKTNEDTSGGIEIIEETAETVTSASNTENVSELESGSNTTTTKKVEYITHTVQPKETVYALTKKYEISKDELLRLNPEFPELKDNLLSIDQVLKVKETITYISLEEDLKNHVTHTVKPKETVYGLTRFYNITKDELIRMNPEFPEITNNYLQIGQVLRIRDLEDKLDTDDTLFYQDSIAYDSNIKLAILLPFKAKSYDTIKYKDVFKGNALTNMVTDFYLGAEIAIDSIKQQGISVDVSVFDTGNKGKNIPSILNNNSLNDIDAVVGPFYSSKAELVANRVKAPVIFPHFSRKQHEFKASSLVKAEPDVNMHSTFLANYLKSRYNGETIFIVGDDKTNSNKQITVLESALKKHDSIKDIHVLKPEDGYIKKERFTDHMPPKTHCWVIMTSEDKVAVADELNSMIVLPEEVTAEVFAIYKNKAYNSIDNNKLARVGFTYVSNHFTDESATTTKAFNKKYRDKNFSSPSAYATKGFDITYDILMRLASGKKLSDTFKEGASLRLESKFHFEKKPFKSTSNKGLFLIKYNKDLSLTRLK